jgi:hypothetical protein
VLIRDDIEILLKVPHSMSKATPDLFRDPFRERAARLDRGPLQLLGGRFRFESNSRELLRSVDSAYRDLPSHRLSAAAPRLRVGLQLTSSKPRGRRSEPQSLQMLSSAEWVGGATGSSNFVVVSAAERSALVSVSEDMLRFPYHIRYELIEFAVFTLATRVQGLVPLHAACIGRGRRGFVLMGASGSGKSTVSLQCLLNGFEFVSEDSTFVAPGAMLATGVANFVHVRSDSLHWIKSSRDAGVIRRSPVISRRSGVRKFEVDLRRGGFRLAPGALELAAVIFLSAQSAAGRALVQPLSKGDILRRLAVAQPYAANQPGWPEFCRKVTQLGAFELRRGAHPLEAVAALDNLLDAG